MLELAGVAYVGAGVLGSAVAMDKAMAKTVLDAHDIPQPRWRQLVRADLSRPGLAEGLLDELQLAVAPVVDPDGRRLSDGLPSLQRLELVSATPTESGAQWLVLRPARG
jgi:hypothetical protein